MGVFEDSFTPVFSTSYRWKKSAATDQILPQATEAYNPLEEEEELSEFQPSPPHQPEVIQTTTVQPVEPETPIPPILPTPVIEPDPQTELYEPPPTEQPLVPPQEPTYSTKPVDLTPIQELIADLNHLVDGVKHDEKEEEESCVLKANLEACEMYLCNIIRSMLALPFPNCYAAEKYNYNFLSFDI